MLITLFLIATATFFLLEAVPGDPLTERASKLSPTVKENLYKRYGLDKPMMERYVITMKGICKGEFGESVVYAGQTVQKLIHDRLPVSARLGIQQVLVGITIGLLLGILAAMRRGSFWDYMVIALSVLLISIPNLIFGLMLQKIFAGNLKVLPTIGWPAGEDLWFGGWEYTILPTLTGCFSYIATYARLLKTSMLDVTIGFTDSSVEILKPSIYKAVNKVNKYYKKALKKEEVSREVATFNMGHILDCANVMCFDDNSKSFEEALKSADEPEEIIALFNQVTLRKL